MSSKIKNIKNEKFGRLTVVKFIKRADRKTYWECICDCGNTIITTQNNLQRGSTKSCGCLFKEGNNKKNNLSNSRLYHIWRNMKARCYRKNSSSYKNYGAKGIIVCEEWKNNFMTFYNWAIANGYDDNLTIDRIDNNRMYEPNNCRWTTRKEQNNNTSRNVYITFNGITLTRNQWAEKIGINKGTLKNRLTNKWSPWSIEKALTTPVNNKKK